MKLRSLLLFLPLVASACAQTPPAALKPGRYEKDITVNGLSRHYIMRVPPAYTGQKMPVVVVLHGWTASAALAEQYTMLAAKGDKEGFVSVFADGSGKVQGWNTGFLNLGVKDVDDVAFMGSLLDQVEKDINVDKKREYVAGHSNGAMMADLLGAKMSDRLAAIAVVAGTVGMGTNTIPDPKGPISAIMFHGKMDNMVAYDEKSTAMLMSISAPASVKWWVTKDGCSPTPKVTTVGDSTIELYTGGKDGTEVEFVSMAKAGHDWPGGLRRGGDNKPAAETVSGVSAADMIWDFFKTHPKK